MVKGYLYIFYFSLWTSANDFQIFSPGYHLYFALFIVSSAMKVFFFPISQISLFFYTSVIKEGMYLVRMRLTYLSTEPLKLALEGMKGFRLLNAFSVYPNGWQSYDSHIFRSASFAFRQ